MEKIETIDLGLQDYAQVWKYQEEVFDKNIRAKEQGESTRNTLILCEHPHTITIGKHGKKENLLYQTEYLKGRGVDIFQIDRGGDVTYHGPGQLVAYPVFDLEVLGIGLRQYVYTLEEVMIQFLALYGVVAERDPQATGVWIDSQIAQSARKIGAIGVKCSRFITMHGFALNIQTDLSYFSLINPCGFVDKGVTSLEKEIGRQIDMQTAKSQIRKIMEEVF